MPYTLLPENQLPSPTDQLSSTIIDTFDVAGALLSLNTTKVTGTDHIVLKQGRMQDCFKGGARSKNNRARKGAPNFFATPILITVFSSLLARGYYSFRQYWDGEATIGEGLLNEGAFILRYCHVALNF